MWTWRASRIDVQGREADRARRVPAEDAQARGVRPRRDMGARRHSGPATAGRERTATPGAVTLGRITGLFGVRGWVKVHSYTRPPETVLQYGPWGLRTPQGVRELAGGRPGPMVGASWRGSKVVPIAIRLRRWWAPTSK